MAERTDVATRMRVTDDTPERSADEIRQDIVAKRESISDTVDRLGERIHETLDWREYIADYPFVALGAAAGVGFLLSGLFKPNPSPNERILDAVAEMVEDLSDRFRDTVQEVAGKKSGPSRTVKAAATAMASKYAMDFLKNKLNDYLQGSPSQRRAASLGSTPATGHENFDRNIETYSPSRH